MPKMTLDPEGRLVCPENPALITYNTPFPTENGSPGGFAEPAYGMVFHTEVGYEHNVEEEFNSPSAQASAFASIGIDGHVHQYGPIGKGWKAWTQVDGNPHWRGVEHEDQGNPSTPLSAAQVESFASVIEACSEHDGFPLQVTDDPVNGRGLITHEDGGEAWGGHSCPGPVRAAQRPDLIARAEAIRGGAPAPTPHPTPAPSTEVEHLQQAVHVTPDNDWGPVTDAALQSVREHTHNVAEQDAVGTKPDGDWGPMSAAAENVTIHRIQTGLNVKADGDWGPITDRAFLAARARFYRAA